MVCTGQGMTFKVPLFEEFCDSFGKLVSIKSVVKPNSYTPSVIVPIDVWWSASIYLNKGLLYLFFWKEVFT